MKISNCILMLLVAASGVSACEKNAVQVLDDPDAGKGANVKFFNFAVGSPAVNFYVGDRKVTAVSATGCYLLTDTNRDACLSSGIESTAGVAYGGAGNGPNAWYSDVAPGQSTITGKIAAATDKGLAISNVQANLQAGKFYSYYQSGVYDTRTKTADGFIVEDVMPPSDFSVAYVRFVNASSTAAPMTLFATNRDSTKNVVPVGAAVAYKSAGTFVAVPPGSYDLATRTEGSSANVFSRASVPFFRGRAYTIAAHGTTAKVLDNTANR